MRKFFKWLGIALGSLVALVLVGLGVLYFRGSAMIGQKYDIPAESIAIPTDVASIARGGHFVHAICVGCHTPDLSGMLMINAPFAQVYSANLTPGQGGAGAQFTNADFVRAIRHGVDDQGRALIIMPAHEFWNFSDQDLGDIIAYLRTVPPVDKQHPDPQINAMGRILFAAGAFGPDIVPASVIAHDLRPAAIPQGVTAAYGGYLVSVTGCHDCHGAQLAGGRSAKPGALDAPNLTPGGELQAWNAADFIHTIRSGTTPGGHTLNPDEMPWKDFQNYSDDELTAIFLYLQSQPALPTVRP